MTRHMIYCKRCSHMSARPGAFEERGLAACPRCGETKLGNEPMSDGLCDLFDGLLRKIARQGSLHTALAQKYDALQQQVNEIGLKVVALDNKAEVGQ